MPQVQYVNQLLGINETRGMPTPVKIQRLDMWLKVAQLTIPQIPRTIDMAELPYIPEGHDGWYVLNTDISVRWIKFELRDKFDRKAQIVIDRRKSQFDRC